MSQNLTTIPAPFLAPPKTPLADGRARRFLRDGIEGFCALLIAGGATWGLFQVGALFSAFLAANIALVLGLAYLEFLVNDPKAV